jgi:pyruvate ferredoxin oxidoreductase beta subunit
LAKDQNINVFAVAGDGGTADIGFASLSGAAERNDDGVYFCFDNEAYMNTGVQRSSQTPINSWTTSTLEGKPQPKKNLPMIMASHGIPYVATASVGFPHDFVSKAEKARDMQGGFRYLHVQGACSAGWRFPENKSIEISRLAVDCGIWLLYEIEEGEFKLTYKPTPRKPVKAYLSKQGRFSHLNETDIDKIQAQVDETCKKYGF